MLYSIIRSTKVFDFRNEVIVICYDYNRSDMPDKKIVDAFLIYRKMPSYNDMIYSFKPLKLETYVNKTVVNELNRTYEYNLKDLK